MISAGVIGSLLIATLSNQTSFSYSSVIAGSCLISALSCLPIGLLSSNKLVLLGCFCLGVGFGNTPALFAQISAEAPLEVQGRVQGINYAVMTVAWALGPFAYWLIYISLPLLLIGISWHVMCLGQCSCRMLMTMVMRPARGKLSHMRTTQFRGLMYSMCWQNPINLSLSHVLFICWCVQLVLVGEWRFVIVRRGRHALCCWWYVRVEIETRHWLNLICRYLRRDLQCFNYYNLQVTTVQLSEPNPACK